MRRAYLEARREAECRGNRAGLPIEITYDGGGDAVRGLPPRRRLRFRLWDRRSVGQIRNSDRLATRSAAVGICAALLQRSRPSRLGFGDGGTGTKTHLAGTLLLQWALAAC